MVEQLDSLVDNPSFRKKIEELIKQPSDEKGYIHIAPDAGNLDFLKRVGQFMSENELTGFYSIGVVDESDGEIWLKKNVIESVAKIILE